MRRTLRTLVLPFALTLVAATGCGGDVHEGTVTTALELKNGDVSGTTIAKDKGISESDARWAGFLQAAQEKLGRPPERIRITGATLQLDAAKAQGVGAVEEALQGEVVVYLRDSATNTLVDVARGEDLRGSGQVELDGTDASLDALQAALLGSNFRVGVRGGTNRTSSESFTLALLVGLKAEAE